MSFVSALGGLFGRRETPPVVAAAPYVDTESQREVVRKTMVGGAGTLVTAGTLEDLDPNPEVRGRNWYGEPGKIGLGSKMMRDPHVRQSVEYVIAPLVAGNWRHRPTSDAPIDREIAAFCDYAWFECLPWKRHIRSIVRGYVRDGFFLGEMTDDYKPLSRDRFPNHPGGGMAVLPTGIHERPAWSVTRFNPSKASPEQLDSVQQYIRGGDAEAPGYRDLSAKRFLRFTWDQDGANFAGLPILRSAYQPWKLKMILLTLDAIKHERTGTPLPVLTLGEDADKADIEKAQIGLAELRANEKSFWINPANNKLEWLQGGEGGSNLDAAIARCNIDIAMNVAAGFMLLSLQGSTGSQALSGTQRGQHHLGMVGHAEFVTSVFNFGADGWSPVERIVRMNYGPNVAVPRLEVRHLPTRDWLEVVKAYFNGVQVRGLTADDPTENDIRSILQLDPLDKETARVAVGPLPAPQQDTWNVEGVLAPDANGAGGANGGAVPVTAKSEGTPDDTTPKDQQTIFGYHLQFGVARINEARKNLNLDPVPYGEQTVPEFLKSLEQMAAAVTPPASKEAA